MILLDQEICMNFNELIVRGKMKNDRQSGFLEFFSQTLEVGPAHYSPHSLRCCFIWPWELTLEKGQQIFDSMSLNLNSPSTTLPSLLFLPNVSHSCVYYDYMFFTLRPHFLFSFLFFFPLCLLFSCLRVSLFLCSKLFLRLFLKQDNVTLNI